MNPHGLNDHRHLKPARLPIPPLLHVSVSLLSQLTKASIHGKVENVNSFFEKTLNFYVFCNCRKNRYDSENMCNDRQENAESHSSA